MDISRRAIEATGSGDKARGCSRITTIMWILLDWRSVSSCPRGLGKDSYLQPEEAPPYPRRRQASLLSTRILHILWLNVILAMMVAPAAAAYVKFENCLSPNIVNSDPLQLQFIPKFFFASFNTTAPSHNLNVTVYGNVSGIATKVPYPAPDDRQWDNPNATVGKIVDLSESNNKYSTLFAKFNVLSYTPYDATPSRFCNSIIHGRCPLGPSFNATG